VVKTFGDGPVRLDRSRLDGLPTGEVGDRMVASRERGLVERERRADNRRFVNVRITADIVVSLPRRGTDVGWAGV
jgi:hypothetical protein